MKVLLTTARNKRKLLILVVATILLCALAWYVNSHFSLVQLAEQEGRVRDYIALNPWTAFFVGFGIYAGLSLVPGTGGKGIVYGWLFGFWQAVTIVTVGLTLAAMAIFSLSRYLFRESIERRYTNPVSLRNKHLVREGAFYLLALRMAHAPYSIVNPISGASRVPAWTFCWTTALGLLPANTIWVYVGVRLPSLQELASSGPGSFIDPPLILAMVGCAALAPLIRWILGHFGILEFNTRSQHATRHESHRGKHDDGY
jgi:uncharacterized membrane protein YdjX (TVP38/TMEM64 family)